MSTFTLPIESGTVDVLEGPLLLPGAIGFFFVFRICLTFLFFQDNPVAATIINIGIDLALVFIAILYTTGNSLPATYLHLQLTPIRWMLALFTLSLVSVLWSGTESVVAALAYWSGMVADMVIILLLLRHGQVVRLTEAIMKGAVCGAAALAVIAWCSPTTDDLRLGNDLFLHPNDLGLEMAIGALLAQYLVPRGAHWKWLGIGLAITLLRTLSKTAIIAFVIAETWYVARNQRFTRKAKMGIIAIASIVVASFWSLLDAYIDIYTNTGSTNQVETLTGRTVLWGIAFTMSLEKPWFGHGINSFKSLIPVVGIFEAVHAHNELLQQFFEYGLVGVFVALAIYISFYRLARHSPSNELKALAIALVIFSLVRGLADTVRFGLSFPLWLMTALSICLARASIVEGYPS